MKMSESNQTSSRRHGSLIAGVGAAAFASVSLLPVDVAAVGEGNAIRPINVNISDEALSDSRRRVLAARWPDPETVNDHSQGVQLSKIHSLAQYWGTEYDWVQGGGEAKCVAAVRTPLQMKRVSSNYA